MEAVSDPSAEVRQRAVTPLRRLPDGVARLALVTGLCRELSKLGLSVGMSDARPAVVIRVREIPPLWITVDASGRFFEWAEADHRHPVTDTVRTAALISEYVQAQRQGSGNGS